jgi:SPOR domain
MDRNPSTPETPATPSGLFDRAPTPSRRTALQQPSEQRFDARAFRQTAASARDSVDVPSGLSTEPPAHVPVARRPRRHGVSYVAMWAGLGLVSAGYLGAVGLSRTGSFDAALAPVTQTLDRLAKDIAELKQSTASIDARERETAEKVRISESRLDTFAQLAANVPQSASAQLPGQGQRPTNRAVLAETASAPAQPPTQPPTQPSPQITAKVPGMAVVMPAQRQTASAPVPSAPAAELPSLKPVPLKPVAGVAAPLPGAAAQIQTGSLPSLNPSRPAGLLVASGPSLDSIRLSWNVLTQTHGQVLGKLDPRIVPAGDGSAFQLIAGPFANDAEAQKACTALKARGVGCRAAEYTGAPL